MNVLLHSCCGPCASACVPRLKEEGHAVTMFYSNSNIDTRAEFEKRLEAARTLAAAEGVTLVADDYDHAAWLRAVADGYENEPEKGRRCERCYRYNLARTASYAAAHGFESFTTSLTVSPSSPARRTESLKPSRFLKSSRRNFGSSDDAKIFALGLCGLTVSEVVNDSNPCAAA